MKDDPPSSLPSRHRFGHPRNASNIPVKDDPSSSLPSRHRFDHQAERLVSQRLSALRCGDSGYISDVRDPRATSGSEIERRLLEMGFVEGAYVEMLHKGFLGQDPLAVRINQSVTVALRRREADAVLVKLIVSEKR